MRSISSKIMARKKTTPVSTRASKVNSAKGKGLLDSIGKKGMEEINKSFSKNALHVIGRRYLLEMPDGKKETPADMFARIATTLAAVEKVLKVCKQALDEGIDKYLVGGAAKPVFREFN